MKRVLQVRITDISFSAPVIVSASLPNQHSKCKFPTKNPTLRLAVSRNEFLYLYLLIQVYEQTAAKLETPLATASIRLFSLELEADETTKALQLYQGFQNDSQFPLSQNISALPVGSITVALSFIHGDGAAESASVPASEPPISVFVAALSWLSSNFHWLLLRTIGKNLLDSWKLVQSHATALLHGLGPIRKRDLLIAIRSVSQAHGKLTQPPPGAMDTATPLLPEAPDRWWSFAVASFGSRFLSLLYGKSLPRRDDLAACKILEIPETNILHRSDGKGVPVHALIRSGCNRLILTIRGTYDGSDLAADLSCDTSPVPWLQFSDQTIYAHQGILEAANRLWDEIAPLAETLLRCHTFSEFVACGYSLGGAVASLFTLRWNSTRSHPPMRCVTFGAPPCVSNRLDDAMHAVVNVIVESDFFAMLSVSSLFVAREAFLEALQFGHVSEGTLFDVKSHAPMYHVGRVFEGIRHADRPTAWIERTSQLRLICTAHSIKQHMPKIYMQYIYNREA